MRFEVKHVSSILKEIRTDGHSPLKVLADDFNIYVIKNDKGHIPPLYLLNECIASVFLHEWELPSPDTCLMKVDKSLVSELTELSEYHKPLYYDNLCFGSRLIENTSDLNEIITTIDKAFYNKIINPLDFLRIALFDTWVENDDRKPTNYNLILASEENKFRVIPIDQAYIFNSDGYNHLNPEQYFPIANDHLLVSDFGKMIKKYYTVDKTFLDESKHYFYLCTKRCEEHFDALVGELSVLFNFELTYTERLKKYLFNKARNERVFEEFVIRLRQ